MGISSDKWGSRTESANWFRCSIFTIENKDKNPQISEEKTSIQPGILSSNYTRNRRNFKNTSVKILREDPASLYSACQQNVHTQKGA